MGNFLAWFDGLIPKLADGRQRLLFKTPHTFDASVLELLWPLVAGQTMVVAQAGGQRDPQYLARVIDEQSVSVVQFVPSLLSAFLDVVDDEPLLPGLSVLFSGGEALPPAVAQRFHARVPQARVVNLFGPTEAAVYTMSAEVSGVGAVVPIGRPMANTSAWVLDSRLHLVPDGVVGELYLGGVQSARGYASRADLTRSVALLYFVPCDGSEDSRSTRSARRLTGYFVDPRHDRRAPRTATAVEGFLLPTYAQEVHPAKKKEARS